jgi:ADP-ribosyl-[dinitrogen reductase] hydrolase
MPTNREILEEFFEKGKINLRRGDLFDTPPEPMPEGFDFDRVNGMMLGLAVGDSLGKPTEGMLPNERKTQFGEIRDYLPTRYSDRPVGLPSDDTQLAYWTLEQMIEEGRFIPENVAKRFCRDRIFGIGSSVSKFLTNFKSGSPWYEAGPESAGNGALMRIAPMLIPHLKTATADLWVDTALSAMITHNDSGSIAACVSFINMLWQLLRMDSPPQPEWWLETYIEAAKELELNKKYRPRTRAFPGFAGPISQFVEEQVGEAYRKDKSVKDACDLWYSGAYLLETVPCVLFTLMKHGDNLEEAMVRAVNDTRDNDTIAAIVGAAVGALHGKRRIPERWLENHSGRTSFSDDGRIFELLEMAENISMWNPSA